MIITGIILAAGSSTRYGKGMNKNFEVLGDKIIIEYSIDAFNENSSIDKIIVVTRDDEKDFVSNIIKSKNLSKEKHVICGGNSRCESVYNAIKDLKSDIVLIHDAARPLIKDSFINDCIHNISDEIYGVSVGVKSKDTIKIVNEDNVVISTTNRNATWLIQTPQCFKLDVLLECYNKTSDFSCITDDLMMLELNNYKVKLIPGDYTNIKITTSEDLNVLKSFLK